MHRAILADDERRTRSAIRKLGDWEALGIEIVREVQDGDELWEAMLAERPDLILTDMRMPGLSGAELIKKLSEAHAPVRIIVVSGYDDFAYMKQAISSRVVDYILKPVHKEALNEALKNAVKEIDARKDTQEASLDVQRRLNESQPLLNESIFYQFLTGSKDSEEEFIRCLDIPGLSAQELRFTAVVLMIENFQEVADRRYKSNPDLLLFAMVNMVDELIAGQGKSFRSRHQDNELLMNFFKPLTQDEFALLLVNISGKLKEFLDVSILSGVGGSYTSPTDVKHSMNEARAALSQLNAKEGQFRISFYDKMKLHVRSPQIQIGSSERQLGAAIDTANIGFIKQTVTQVYMELAQSDYMSITNIRKLNADMLYQLERLVDTVEDKPAFISELTSLRHKILHELNLHFVLDCVLQFIESLTKYALKQRKERKVIYDIRDFLVHNYAKKHSLKELSDMFFLSKEYISKMFKEEFGMNLFEFIAMLKMEKAKQMLSSDDRKLREIVDALGFNDESHFSKAFKKYTGHSPRAYRDQWGANQLNNE
ncbi:response regulator [Paenibacillus puerhi]|uniref:response regulator n=1 Tax=Paenibacillus puerhi TaxID=2692622 RepID=UPI001356C062|nr:response regulator [Paenibacillus puerhi]